MPPSRFDATSSARRRAPGAAPRALVGSAAPTYVTGIRTGLLRAGGERAQLRQALLRVEPHRGVFDLLLGARLERRGALDEAQPFVPPLGRELEERGSEQV